MTVRQALRRLVGRGAGGTIRVRVLLKGRIGEGWYDVNRELTLPVGAN